MKVLNRPVFAAQHHQLHVTFPDGRRFHHCGCIDVEGRAFLLCRKHHDGRPDLNPHHQERHSHV